MDVQELLEAKGLLWVQKSIDEVDVVCPNEHAHHGGSDARPSFDINTERLVAHCFACNFSLKGEALVRWLVGGDLDDYAMRSLAIRAKIKQIEHVAEASVSEERQIFIPPGEPWSEDGFRGISIETYNKLKAIHCVRGFYADRLVFPIYLNGELLGVDARALKGQEPKYIRNKGSSCQTDWLFPYDIVKQMNSNYVILGEGIFHAVNGIDKEFPALCFFGGHNFSRTKLRMIMSLGVDYVVYFRDNDKAGLKAEQEIGHMIQDWLPCYSADTSRVPEGKDLGDLSQEEIQWAIDNRTKTKVPECLPEDKPKVGTYCKRRCYFKTKEGICGNAFW